ncbi:hypothetical protein [Clostridium botulinum]|nr:hypothetical protein [Clostridium botulinum]
MNNYSNLTKEQKLAIREKATKRAMRRFANMLLIKRELRVGM